MRRRGETMRKSKKERRNLDRLELEVPALIQATGGDGSDHRILLTRDISSNGAFFRTAAANSYDCRVDVKLLLQVPSLDSEAKYVCLTTTGEVLRRDPTGLAVRFGDDYQLSCLT
jgi:hypothetical protein